MDSRDPDRSQDRDSVVGERFERSASHFSQWALLPVNVHDVYLSYPTMDIDTLCLCLTLCGQEDETQHFWQTFLPRSRPPGVTTRDGVMSQVDNQQPSKIA